MEIFIPTLTEIEEIVERCLVKHLSSLAASKSETRNTQNDRIGLKEAIEITFLKESALYKLTMTDSIPYQKFGKRLVFSRNELESWVAERTVRRQSVEEIAVAQLAKVARKKINKY
jgi:predicted DNA-binding transcriptional regulator AlpA